jgi:hypothetical protein
MAKKLLYLLIVFVAATFSLSTQAGLAGTPDQLAIILPSHPVPGMLANVSALWGPEITISSSSSVESMPAIAYNSVRDEYMVVWREEWPTGQSDIQAARLRGDGVLLGIFTVATGSNAQKEPAVAYDSRRDRYLVVWSYDYYGNNSDWDIFGRIIPWNGPDQNYMDWIICGANYQQRLPKVAYAYTADNYLVVWENTSPIVADFLSYAVMEGSNAGTTPVSTTPDHMTGSYMDPDVAYNLGRDQFLLTWTYSSGATWDIYGMRLDSTGSPLSGGNPSVTGEFNIAGWTAREDKPQVAACSSADQYLVVWRSDQDTDDDGVFGIYARPYSGLAVPGTPYLVGEGLDYLPTGMDCGLGGAKYLLAWKASIMVNKPDPSVGNPGIFASLIYTDQSMQDSFELIAPGTASIRQEAAVAGGKTSFLVGWRHERADHNDDIHGRLLTHGIYLPVVRK